MCSRFRPIRHLLLILAAASVLTCDAVAQTSNATAAGVTTLTLRQAVDLALKNNRQLIMARLEMNRADYRVSEAVGTALPSISASGQYTRSLLLPVFFLPDFSDPSSGRIIPYKIGSDHALQFGLTATQVLFNSAVFTGVGTARIYQKASREIYREAYNQTVSGVTSAFNTVIFVQKVYEMVQASMKNAEDNFHSVQSLQKQGMVSDYDAIRAEVQVENVRPTVVQAERNVVMAKNALRLALGIAPDQPLELAGDLTVEEIDPVILEKAESLVRENNAGLRAMELQTTINSQIVSIYRSEFLPTLAAFGNYSWQDQKNRMNQFGLGELVRSSQVGIVLSLSLFNGWQTTSRVNQAEVDYLKSKESQKSAEDAAVTNVQNIRLRIEEARKRIAAQGRTVEQAEKGYKIATTRYSAGTGTQLEINDADLALMRARVNRVQAMYDYAVAKAELEAVLGMASPDDIR